MRHKISIIFPLLAVLIILNGCASLKAYPDRSENVDEALKQLEPYFSPQVEEQYNKETDAVKKKALRNDIVNARIRSYDLQFNLFQQALYRENVTASIATDWIALGLGGAIATVGGEATKAALGAISGGVVGAKGAVDKHAYFEKTMPALLSTMVSLRKAILVRLLDGLTKNIDEYPLSLAVIDLENYFQAGTLPAAITSITEQSGAAGKKSGEDLLTVRTNEFVEKKRQERISEILDKIDKLADPKAIELATNPPVHDSKIDKLVKLRDPGNQRLSNGVAAKQILKMIAVLSRRSDDDLNAWDAALKAVE